MNDDDTISLMISNSRKERKQEASSGQTLNTMHSPTWKHDFLSE